MFLPELLILLALGIGVGAYGTLIGAGGGFLVVPLLIITYHFEPRMAVGTSLVFVFFNALSGTIAYLRQRRVDVRVGGLFALLTIPGAILGAFITSYFESSAFKMVFAAILTVTSIYLLVRPLKEVNDPKHMGYHRRIIDFKGEEHSYSVPLLRGFLISFLVGFVSSIFGIGGGIIHVPAMIFLLGFPVHISTATSHFILAFSSLVGSATHAGLGNVNFEFAIPIGLGAVLGAQLGALVSQRTRGTLIERLLGLALIAVAIRLIIPML